MPVNPVTLKADIDSQITNKTAPYSISNIDVGSRMKDIVDLNTQGTSRPERVLVSTTVSTILMPTEYRFVNLWLRNSSPYDLVFHLNYPLATIPTGQSSWKEIELPANTWKDIDIGKTFHVQTLLTMTEVTGVDFSATPIIALIDRR